VIDAVPALLAPFQPRSRRVSSGILAIERRLNSGSSKIESVGLLAKFA
jgi:hypothetical protein